MDEYQESNNNENRWTALRDGSNRWLVVAVVALLGISAVAFAYGYHQKETLNQLAAQAATSNAAMVQMQGQVNALTAKLNEAAAVQAPLPSAPPDAAPVLSSDAIPQSPEAASTPAVRPKPVHTKHHVAKRHVPVDKKYLELQAQLADQQKQLKETQDEVAKDRSDLEGSINSTRGDLNSTRDNLNGSIAKTHDELVALEKRGERSYSEFDLSKSKQFARVGPLTLSLRKADTKHKSYDLAMIIDDNQLQKKKVNLYEPIWIHAETDSQPVQIVVNKIDKDHIHGYISAPKYKPSELAVASSATVTSVSDKASANAPSNIPNPQQPQPPRQ
ncbi:MAG: hypothetical protein WA789_18990 [Candidatus Acidiferrum sp.]